MATKKAKDKAVKKIGKPSGWPSTRGSRKRWVSRRSRTLLRKRRQEDREAETGQNCSVRNYFVALVELFVVGCQVSGVADDNKAVSSCLYDFDRDELGVVDT